MALKKADAGTLHIDPLKRGLATLRLIGNTPFYFNAMSAKAMRTLLIGGGKKTASERKELKHNPEQEFRDSVYTVSSGPTLLAFPAPGVKGAMATAALRTPGVTKTEINQHIFLPHEKVPMWGIPKLKMDVVRSADMARTPDIRTRAFLPRWCAEIEIAFSTPQLSTYSLVSLLANAGVLVGIGDFRQEKGKGGFGTFSVHSSDMDPEAQAVWDEITAEGRDAQQFAMDNPEPADDDTAALMDFLRGERVKRAA